MSDTLVPAKLHDAGIGPLPLCAGCGERLKPGTVYVKRGTGFGDDPVVGSTYHEKCRPADPPPNCSICGRRMLDICVWNRRLPVGHVCPGPHDDDLLPGR